MLKGLMIYGLKLIKLGTSFNNRVDLNIRFLLHLAFISKYPIPEV
ncbi:MAG: hypothetical protein QXR45_06985 [Candidatus Bathyarchaeia archaeon]